MILQIAVPHERDRCIDLKKTVIEPLTLFPTPGQHEDGTFPVRDERDGSKQVVWAPGDEG